MHLCRQVLAAPLRNLEEIGTNRIFATLTQDVPSITRAMLSLPFMIINVAILVGCMVYLGMLSWILLIALILFLIFGVYSFKLPRKKAGRILKLAREEADDLLGHFQALTDGIKELKIHRPRKEAFLVEKLQSTALKLRKHLVVAGTTEAVSNSWGSVLYFVFIGLLLFALPKVEDVTPATLTAYVIVFLYIRAPIASLMELIPTFAMANISLNVVENLGLSLASFGKKEEPAQNTAAKGGWDQIELVGVTHTYYGEGEDHNFQLGPIDLTLYEGELTFLMGGNGSGKTTFAKLITGLYAPEEGEMYLNGEPVLDHNRDEYRQLFSTVFSDFYLFELLGLEGADLESKASGYLKTLSLDHKVEIKDKGLSTVLLSQGQRKRLALLTAYLEDRPIYVFDEWAADQDPVYKEVFYLNLLPELKARGKTVIVITHDDRYYHVADRVVKLENGRIEYNKSAVPVM
jgi:putative ATP-binding cassette transporter